MTDTVFGGTLSLTQLQLEATHSAVVLCSRREVPVKTNFCYFIELEYTIVTDEQTDKIISVFYNRVAR